MKLSLQFAVCFLSAAPIAALAACEPTPAEFLPPLPEPALAARAKAFSKACAESPVQDMDDKRLAPRAALAQKGDNPGKRINDQLIEALPPGTVEPGQKTTTIVSFVVEADGKIADPTVVGRSGNRKYDTEVLGVVKRAKTYAVMTLDGQPVRAFLTMTFSVGNERR